MSKAKTQAPPYQSPDGFHRHQCWNCQTIWEHANSCSGDFHQHCCPKCGEECEGGLGWNHYTGPLPPTKKERPT